MKLAIRIYLGLVERYLAWRRKIVFNPSGAKLAVISFVMYPPRFNRRYLAAVHNNRLTCQVMVNALVARGYRVHVHHYLDQSVETKDVAVFIGHNVTFHKLANRMPANCFKLLITSGSNPVFDNEAFGARVRYFEQRTGLSVPFKPMNTDHVVPNGEAATKIMMLGNKTVVGTWPPVYAQKRVVYHNITLFKPQRKSGRGRTFLYMSSIGVLRRGLDIAIEAFEGLDAELLICSPYVGEQWFFDYYAPVFARCPNIRFCGYVDMGSELFQELVRKADFGLLPSCSEGEAGSALTMMTMGLLPVITDNTGFPDVDRYGYLIRDATVEGLRALVRRVVDAQDAEIEEKRTVLLQEVPKGQLENFVAEFAAICDGIKPSAA
jgi:glycosyltransferase involved in cell wall biosynthesis